MLPVRYNRCTKINSEQVTTTTIHSWPPAAVDSSRPSLCATAHLRAQPARASLTVEQEERRPGFVREHDACPLLGVHRVCQRRAGVEHAGRGARETAEVLIPGSDREKARGRDWGGISRSSPPVGRGHASDGICRCDTCLAWPAKLRRAATAMCSRRTLQQNNIFWHACTCHHGSSPYTGRARLAPRCH